MPTLVGDVKFASSEVSWQSDVVALRSVIRPCFMVDGGTSESRNAVQWGE